MRVCNIRCCFFSSLVFFSLVYYYNDVVVDVLIFQEHHLVERYFVNTIGCRMLTMVPNERDVMLLWRGLRRDFCASELDLTSFSSCDNNYLRTEVDIEFIVPRFGVTNLESFECQYHAMQRKTDFDNRYLYSRQFPLLADGNNTIEPHADIIRAECFLNGTNIYNGVHFYVQPPDEWLRNTKGIPPLKLASDAGSLSVLILGLDSISQMHFHRSMGRTANFLLSLPHVVLKGFNRLGNNTFDSLMPLLSGLSGPDLKDLSLKFKSLDSCPFIWKVFQQAGYETALGEDNIDKSMFAKGFEDPPTDFYLRPALLEMWLKTRTDQVHGTHCNEKDSYAMVLREFLFKILPHHKAHRFFTFLWWTQGIDHVFNYGRKLDLPFLKMFNSIASSGLLKNTLLLVVSNHGLNKGRFYKTVQGKVEESLPLAMLCYPRWLEERYPQAISNLKTNNHRLVTAFDLHATLLDLPNLTSLEDEQLQKRSSVLEALEKKPPRGISLFLPIPENRDCALASIPTEYCLCQQHRNTSTADGYVLRAARLIIRNINKILHLHTPPCSSLSLDRVLSAEKWRRTADDHQSEFRVRLLATPGGGQFEGVVRYTGYKLAIDGSIKRVNDYGNDSHCIQNYLIEMYCFCH
ncbi:uncharacterized protein LOC128253364 isoform X1 [Drosophila gunungcola]|uniref:Uncharacterized protein n=2 Tax=Drosophila gunungcola TaxID=103775 RepID=A0A9P9YJS2_9MUSC|nr:uncharacterized protein LOC128253364 isoform X1 [Drosophila gunungcola]KAI8038038.1 hypothetical protein M5D96_009079 [Drosophila gunungcola]